MLTLALDTASRTGGVALLSEREIVGEITFRTDANHAAILLPAIEYLLSLGRIQVRDIDLLAFTSGPGSFTGVRIGASTVKGLALDGNKPVAAVSTLEALAWNVSPCGIDICPMIDARKNEIYTALYRTGPDGLPEVKETERVTEPASFISRLAGEVIFLGEGVRVSEDIIRSLCRAKVRFAPGHLQFVRASAVGLLGIEKFLRGQTEDIITLTPRYLRLSQAEAVRRNRFGRSE